MFFPPAFRSVKCTLSPSLFWPSRNLVSKWMLNSNNYHILSNPTNLLILSCTLLFYESSRNMLPIKQ